MIIDCHGHYTTAPKALEDWLNRQVAGIKDPSAKPRVAELARVPAASASFPKSGDFGYTTNLPLSPHYWRSLDELVAAALLLYPRYLDPKTGLPCPPEILIQRMTEGTKHDGVVVQLRRLQGRFKKFATRAKGAH